MTAQGKITVANMRNGTRILLTTDISKRMATSGGPLYLSRVKRGARVATVQMVTGCGRLRNVVTNLGTLHSLAAHQTAWLAPEPARPQVHIGTFRESCESHGCPGCPEDRGAEKVAQAPSQPAVDTFREAGPGETPETCPPEGSPIKPQDVVRFDWSDSLYEVLEVERDRVRDSLTGEVTETTLLRLDPQDPIDHRAPFWAPPAGLVKVPPVADIRTVAVALESLGETRETFMVQGCDSVCQFVTDGERAHLLAVSLTLAPIKVRVGDSIRVDGVLWRIVWDTEAQLRRVGD